MIFILVYFIGFISGGALFDTTPNANAKIRNWFSHTRVGLLLGINPGALIEESKKH